MKKKAFAILTLCISLFAAVALVGCGGSDGATGSSGGGGAEKPAMDMRTDLRELKRGRSWTIHLCVSELLHQHGCNYYPISRLCAVSKSHIRCA